MVEKDLLFIKKQSKINEDDNFKFRSFLKMLDITDKKLDNIVKKITLSVQKDIECSKCNNCCKVLNPIITKKELEDISKYLNIEQSDFINNFVNNNDNISSDKISLKSPCPFFKNDKCEIENVKPDLCKTYPYLLKGDFRHRLLGVINNCEICPIVYNVYEELKKKLWR